MARFVLFAKSLCFDVDQQVLFPVQSPAHRVALTPLQTAILRRVIDADGKLVRNQTLHALFQRVPSDIPFAERLTATIAAINQQAQLAHAPGPLVHQVPLIGCVLADQVDVAPLSDEPVAAPAAAVVSPLPAPAPASVKKKRPVLRWVIVALLLVNVALALLARQMFAPVQHDALDFRPLLRIQNSQVFIPSHLKADSWVVQDALRRYRQWQPRLPDGSAPPMVYINPVRTRLFSSTFLCAKPIAQKDNECISWMVSAQEIPDA
ncbi:hypothetical protein EGJ48_19900 [Pantoea dispersa]|uniref:hypothetical protein n=1 Tax=Pantoea dispersa TaxID=59814 RepID=UPI000F676860|nr:hypothetical protein [Pantoea dispersa]RRW67068.1 hypothetical protein EGJ48_19900 [Pantoea dispersa]